MRIVLDAIPMLAEGATVLHEDSTGAIRWSSGEKRAKHVDIRFHFLSMKSTTARLKFITVL